MIHCSNFRQHFHISLLLHTLSNIIDDRCPKVARIGHNWISLTWNATFHDNISVTCNDTTVTNISVMETSIEIYDLIEGVTYNCTIKTPDVACVTLFTPGEKIHFGIASYLEEIHRGLGLPVLLIGPVYGDKCCINLIFLSSGTGNATDITSNNTVFGHFIGDKSSCNLTCTILSEDNVQTDTVWSIERYRGIEDIQRISNDELFEIATSSNSDITNRNHLNILDCSVRDLNGTTVYCGSHVNPKQASFNFTVCGELM